MSTLAAAASRSPSLLPHGRPERDRRAVRMVEQIDLEGFGNYSWYVECQATCVKEISIVRMDCDYACAMSPRTRH